MSGFVFFYEEVRVSGFPSTLMAFLNPHPIHPDNDKVEDYPKLVVFDLDWTIGLSMSIHTLMLRFVVPLLV